MQLWPFHKNAAKPSSEELINPTLVRDTRQAPGGGSNFVDNALSDQLRSKYHFISQLGEGGFGSAYLARERYAPHREVVVKVLRRPVREDADAWKKNFQNEINALQRVHPNRHPHLVHLIGFSDAPQDPWIAMEYVDAPTLGKDSTNRSSPPSDDELGEFISSLIAGILELESLDIVHRDLKPANLLWAGSGNLRIVDYGISRQSKLGGRTNSLMGTPGYVCPTFRDTLTYESRCDVFAAGSLICFVANKGRPAYRITGSASPNILMAPGQSDTLSKHTSDEIIAAFEQLPTDTRSALWRKTAKELVEGIEGDPQIPLNRGSFVIVLLATMLQRNCENRPHASQIRDTLASDPDNAATVRNPDITPIASHPIATKPLDAMDRALRGDACRWESSVIAVLGRTTPLLTFFHRDAQGRYAPHESRYPVPGIKNSTRTETPIDVAIASMVPRQSGHRAPYIVAACYANHIRYHVATHFGGFDSHQALPDRCSARDIQVVSGIDKSQALVAVTTTKMQLFLSSVSLSDQGELSFTPWQKPFSFKEAWSECRVVRTASQYWLVTRESDSIVSGFAFGMSPMGDFDHSHDSMLLPALNSEVTDFTIAAFAPPHTKTRFEIFTLTPDGRICHSQVGHSSRNWKPLQEVPGLSPSPDTHQVKLLDDTVNPGLAGEPTLALFTSQSVDLY